MTITEIRYITESNYLNQVTIGFTGGLPNSGSTFKPSTIGEYMTAEIDFKTSLSLNNANIYYDFALSIPFVLTPLNTNQAYQIYALSSFVVNTEYAMDLFIDGTNNAKTFQQNNSQVFFIKKTDSTFTIKHKFYMTYDMLASIQNSLGFEKKYRLTKSTWFTTTEFTNLNGTMYNSTSQRFVYHACKHVSLSSTQDASTIIPINSRFYNKGINNSSPYYLHVGNDFTKSPAMTPTTAMSNVYDTIISFTLNHGGFAPEDAVLRLFKYDTTDILDNFETQLDIQSYSATITPISATQCKVEALVPSQAIGQYIAYIVVYNKTNGYINSHYTPIASEGEVIFPVVDAFTNNYYSNQNYCALYAPSERISARIQYSKNGNNIDIPIGFDDACTALYGRTFDDCKKGVKLEVYVDTDLEETYSMSYIGSVWSAGFDLVNDNSTFLGVGKNLRVKPHWANKNIYFRWYITLDYGTFSAEILYQDTCSIRDYEPLSNFSSISLYDPDGNEISNICNTYPYVEVEVCQVASNYYLLMAVLQKGSVYYENEQWGGGSVSIPTLTDNIIYDLPNYFNTECVRFKIDTSKLEQDVLYTINLIGIYD